MWTQRRWHPGEKITKRKRQRWEWHIYKPKSTKNRHRYQRWGKGKKGPSPRAFRVSMAPSVSLFPIPRTVGLAKKLIWIYPWCLMENLNEPFGQASIWERSSPVVQPVESACNAGDPGSIPGSGRSPGEGNDYPLQYSYLGNLMDRGALWTTVHGAKGQAWLSN